MKKIFFTLIICFTILPVSAAATAETVNFESMLNEHGAIMLLIDDTDGEIIYANEAAARFYGYPKDQMQTMNISQINTLSQEAVTKEMQAAASQERNYFLFKHRLSDGEIRDVEVFSYPVKYGDREVLFSIVHDVTDKVQLEAHDEKMKKGIQFAGSGIIIILMVLVVLLLRSRRRTKKAVLQVKSSNELRQTFMDADKSLIYLKDKNLKYVFVNQALTHLYNKSARELIGKDDFMISDPEFARQIREADQKVLETNDHIEAEIHLKDRVFMSIKFPVAMTDGSIGVGSTIREVTEERLREDFKQKANERNNILVDIFRLNFKNKFEQLDFALNKMLGLTESQYGYIYNYDEETREFTLNSWTKDVMDQCAVVNPQKKYQLEKTGIWGEVVRQRKSIVVNDFTAPNPLKKGYPEGHIQLNNFISVPIFVDEKIVAVVGLSNKRKDYDENDVMNITILMGGVWQAVQRKETQEQLSQERQKYLQTLISIGDGVLVVDKGGNVEMLNKVAQKLTGWTIEEAFGKHYKEVFALSHELPGFNIKDPIQSVFSTNQPQELGNHAILTSRDGTKYFLEDSAAPIFSSAGESQGVVLVFRDVTEKRAQKKKIEYLSFHDELTGLYNRRFFEEELTRLDVERNLPISILMADVNGLKLTNDVFGHACGDELLKAVADVLKSNCRADDIIARWGGDEFVLFLPKTSKSEAEKVASRLKEDISRRRIKSIRGSFSVGFDTKVNIYGSLVDVLSNAEEAMYAQKTLEMNVVEEEELSSVISTLHHTREREKAHSQNVRDLCERMGAAIGLSKMQMRILTDAGYLHDIGKAVLPSELLEPGRRFTEDEKAEIRKHPASGYRILNAFAKTLNLADMVLAHHENWDGSGYPKGLIKDEIPLPARIISICEHYERILNETGMPGYGSKENALKSIKGRSGVKFDPELAELFIQLMEADKD